MKPVRMNSKCMLCLADKDLRKFPNTASEQERMLYMSRVLEILANIKLTDSAPVISARISKVQSEMFGDKMSYAKIKDSYNNLILGMEDRITRRLEEAEDPLRRAIQYATIGNYIDFGAMAKVEEEKLMELLESAEENTVDEREYEAFKQDLDSGKKLVYLTDNCGEVVLDKLLIRTIQSLYPDLKITAIVRGEEILNDATMEDAKKIGLTKIVPVIGNGSQVPGTWMEEISREARSAMQEADVLIAKGQGNFETLQGCGMNIYYMFLCKCELFTKRFGVEKLASMLINDKQCRKYLKFIE